MRKYTDLQRIMITSNLVCRNQNYFPDDETKQILTITEQGELAFQRFLFSGKELEIRKQQITEEAANEIFYALAKYLMQGDRPIVPDMGQWLCSLHSAEDGTTAVKGSVLFGSSTRELHLSDFIRGRIEIPRLFLLDGVPFHRILPDRTRAIYEFSKKWIEIINYSPTWFTLMEDHMMEDMRKLYFEMDFGQGYDLVYREEDRDRGSPAALWDAIPYVHNVDILGSAICSQVYYYVRHAEEPEVHFEDAETWLNSALQRLYQLTKEVSY